MTFETARTGDFSQDNDGRSNDTLSSTVKTVIIGVGGGGSNAVDNMIAAGVRVNQFMAINTDRQALRASKAKKRVQIGSEITKGFGAGANPAVGRQAAIECKEALTNMINDMDLVFITAGMGGGTGTGAAPVVAEIAQKLGKLTIAFVTTPFEYEGEIRKRNAEAGIAKLREFVDAIVIVPNERLASVAKGMTVEDAFRYADDVLRQGVQATTVLINNTGRINVDFADIQTILRKGGDAIIGIGRASGANRAIEAVRRAVNNAVLGTSIEGATRVIVNIEGAKVKMEENSQAVNLVKDICAKGANIIYGSGVTPELKDEIQVTIIATGFNRATEAPQQEAQPAAQTQSVQQQQPQRTEPSQQQGTLVQQSFFGQPQPITQRPTQQRSNNGFVSLDDDSQDSWLSRLRGKK
ncbi:MAG: cell division protein FtsZ [Roseburia sp.]|nr:cell division protein FtsZ [Roseburia sp.]